jgi:hypothetical protein
MEANPERVLNTGNTNCNLRRQYNLNVLGIVFIIPGLEQPNARSPIYSHGR